MADGRDWSWVGLYTFALIDVAGVAAAQVFCTLFNLAGSARDLILLGICVKGYSVAAAATKNSLRATRITTSTLGTLQAAAAIFKHQTAVVDPVAEVRTANPTVTAAAELEGFPPGEAITAAGATAPQSDLWVPPSALVETRFGPGEGLALRQTIAGDVDQTYDLALTWAEVIR